MKTKKNSKIKRIVAIYLAVVFVISAVAVFGVSAASVSKEHTVELATGDGEYDSEVIRLNGSGSISDTFYSYPTIFDGYSSSYNKAVAFDYDEDVYYTEHYFRLYANGGGAVRVTHGTSLPAGNYMIYYYNVSDGGCRARATLTAMY